MVEKLGIQDRILEDVELKKERRFVICLGAASV